MSARQAVDWPETCRTTKEQFSDVPELMLLNDDDPLVASPAWREAFAQPEMFGRIMRDILQHGANTRKGPGRKARLTTDEAAVELHRLLHGGDDFSTQPFVAALRVVIGATPVMQIAEKADISSSRMYRLANGEQPPTSTDLEAIAKAVGKEPYYFQEYRVMTIMTYMQRQLTDSPETSMSLFEKMFLKGGS